MGRKDSNQTKTKYSKGQLSKNNLRKIVIIFLTISLNMCFGCSKEPSHRDGSFEYPQHIFWLRNKKIKFSLRTKTTPTGANIISARVNPRRYGQVFIGPV